MVPQETFYQIGHKVTMRAAMLSSWLVPGDDVLPPVPSPTLPVVHPVQSIDGMTFVSELLPENLTTPANATLFAD